MHMTRTNTVRLVLILATRPTRCSAGCAIDPDADGVVSIERGEIFPRGEVQAEAFQDCQHLRNVTIPTWVRAIGARAFARAGCVPSDRCHPIAVRFEHSEASPSNLATIGQGAFQQTVLLELALPPSLVHIAAEAFQYVARLDAVTVPGSAVSLGRSSFRCDSWSFAGNSYSSSLRNVTFALPSDLAVIEASAFAGCGLQGEVRVPSGAYVEDGAFATSAFVRTPAPPPPPSPPPPQPPEDGLKSRLQTPGGAAVRALIFLLGLLLFLVAVCRCKELPKLTYPPPSTSSQRKPAPVARRLSDLSTRMREFEAWRRERSFAPPPRAPQKEKRAQLPPVASAEVSLEEKERQDYAEVSLTIGEKEEEDREIREPPPPPPPGDAGPGEGGVGTRRRDRRRARRTDGSSELSPTPEEAEGELEAQASGGGEDPKASGALEV